MKLEIAAFNAKSAIIASNAGADRIEFCSDFSAGGLTPDFEATAKIRKEISIPIYVMIRPKPGDFVYHDTEFETMKADIDRFRNLADGFVFGMLTPENAIDPRNQELVDFARKPCTFHRAFDRTDDLAESLETLVLQGFSTVLTSGGKGNAPDNVASLAQLAKQAESRIAIMPGGGVRSGNIVSLKNAGADWFHSSGITINSLFADAEEIGKIKNALMA
jgi:copper homeostasis protein